MAPNGVTGQLRASEHDEIKSGEIDDELLKKLGQRQPLKWVNIVSIILVHIIGLSAVTIIPEAKIISITFCAIYGTCGGLGVTAGAHRLWAHRTYQAATSVRIFLAICFSIAGQNTIPQWVLDHRVHHKFSETDADPHNSNRGFFFSHVGWLMQRKHPLVLSKGKQIDMTDVYADKVVVFHTKYFVELKIFFCFLFPMLMPHYVWGETLRICFLGNILRYVIGLNVTWLVNSAAHIYGSHPYSTQIRPAENYLVALLTLGEGWHNYHHVFPWDYKAAELGGLVYNPTTSLLELFAKYGLVTNLKSPSKELVEKMAVKYGDGTHSSVLHAVEVDETGEEVGLKNDENTTKTGDCTKIATEVGT